jgi:hypothetical protein
MWGLAGRYIDKYARLMQVMQPVASEVFKVCLSSLQKNLLYFLSLLLATFALSETETFCKLFFFQQVTILQCNS